jgi:hypothetical protein
VVKRTRVTFRRRSYDYFRIWTELSLVAATGTCQYRSFVHTVGSWAERGIAAIETRSYEADISRQTRQRRSAGAVHGAHDEDNRLKEKIAIASPKRSTCRHVIFSLFREPSMRLASATVTFAFSTPPRPAR